MSRAPDPEVVAKSTRRQFTAEYRLGILEEADRCTRPGEVGRLLRRERLYTSHLSAWRKAGRNGSLRGLTPKKRGAKPAESNPLSTAKEEQNEEGYWYYLPLVNAGSNQATRSTVRITNLGPNWASDVQLIGFDWDGVRYPRSGTTYLARTVLPNTTVSFTSQDLEVGNSAKLRGSSFGDGEGKWILWILSPHAPLEVTSLLTSRGLTSNISR